MAGVTGSAVAVVVGYWWAGALVAELAAMMVEVLDAFNDFGPWK